MIIVSKDKAEEIKKEDCLIFLQISRHFRAVNHSDMNSVAGRHLENIDVNTGKLVVARVNLYLYMNEVHRE